MELIEQKLIYANKILLFCLMFSSCQYNSTESNEQKDRLLECILTNFTTGTDSSNQPGSFLVGQHNNWTKTTSMIIVSYIPKDKVQYIQANEKSRFKQKDVYFYQTEITEHNSENIIQRIPNELKWQPYISQYSENDIQPPFDPLTIQLVYNYSNNCIEEIIKGENFMKKDWKSKCEFCSNKY